MADEDYVIGTIDGGTPGSTETTPGGEIGEIFQIVLTQLQDMTGQTWPPSKLMRYINLAFTEILSPHIRPDANPVDTDIELAAGGEQSYPAGTIKLLDTLYNLIDAEEEGGEGESEPLPGQTITMVKKKAMDELIPGWMTFPAGEEVAHLVVDPFRRDKFYVFPPQGDEPGSIRVVLSMPVQAITKDSTVFPIDIEFKAAVIDYMIYRALIEETTIPNAQAKAASFYSKFLFDLSLQSRDFKGKQNEG